MQQKTLIALGALLAIGLLAFITLRAPEKGQRTGPRPRPIAALKTADIKELQVTSNNGKDTATLKLDGAAWKVTAPLSYPADAQAAKSAVDSLEKVDFGDVVTAKKDRHAELEVSDDKGTHVVAKDGAGKVLFDAWLGKSGNGGAVMVRPAGKDEVWSAKGLQKYSFARDLKGWRDKTIFTFNADDAKGLTVEAAGQKLVLEKVPPAAPAAGDAKDKPAEPAKWKLVSSTVKVDPFDDSVANGVISGMASLSAADFDDAAKPETAGTATPRFKLSVNTGGATPLVLLVGNAKGPGNEDNWVQVEGKPQIFLLQKFAIERITQKPIDFRDKTMVKAREDDLIGLDIANGADKLTLEKAGAAWKLGIGLKGDLDDSKVKGVVSAFEDFKGSTFADTGDPVATGLGKPAGSATLRLRDKSMVTLLIGAATKDGQDFYVQKAGTPDVMQVKKFQVERFWKKLADVVKSDAAPAK